MIRWILFWLTGWLPCRIITDADQPYLERYFVAQLLGVNVYLHRFVGSDPDRGLHDHPWRWAISLVLIGRYLEETRTGARMVRWFNWLTGDSFHRVVLPAGARDVWTLFVHASANVKRWGFWREDEGRADWTAYTYGGAERIGEWWLTALTGRNEPRRLPLAGAR